MRFLGCKVSQADALLVRDALIDAGHVEAPEDEAEVRVINTCALTREAERKSRRQVNRAARQARTFVSGCAVNLDAGQFGGPGVTTVPGSADRVAADVADLLGPSREGACARGAAAPSRRTRAFIKVQNGCDSRCSFCIIPMTRGPAESRSSERVVADARRRLREGHPELVLTGINIGTYRSPDGDLADLIRRLGRLPGLARLRVSSIEPGDVTDRFLAAVAETPVAAPHLHIPLQSGDAGVLGAMRRGYRPEQFAEACARARAAIPGVNLTTDAIVGFPGEDDAAFRRTVDLVRETGMSKVHVFPYSPRPGTGAADMTATVDDATRRARAAELRDASDRAGFAHRLSRIGQVERVLLETRHDDGGLSGLGADYTRFVVPPATGEPGHTVTVRATAVVGDHVRGEPLR